MCILRSSVVLVGDCTVGKSSLISVFHKGKSFPKNYVMTSGVDLNVKSIKIPETEAESTVELYLFDTSGSIIYNTIRSQYYETCNYVMAVFDCTNRQSFINLKQYLNDCKKFIATNKNISIPPNTSKGKSSAEGKDSNELFGCLIMNKSDLRDAATVSEAEANEFAAANGLAYFEVSALTGENVDEPFNFLAQSYFNKYQEQVRQFGGPS
jgi:small GTP-binding protein